MIILHVTVQVKPEHMREFLEAVRHDAQHSEKDEPGCLRFDVVYRDEAALAAHRESPHFKLYAEKTAPWLAAPPERRFGRNLIPADDAWR
jgi:autoinducer 2-degrading protein